MMKNKADYSKYECPYSHIEKDCGHELVGPEGYQDVNSVWCACGFRGPVFILEPKDLGLKFIGEDVRAESYVRVWNMYPSKWLANTHGPMTKKKAQELADKIDDGINPEFYSVELELN